jgi:glutamate racemase
MFDSGFGGLTVARATIDLLPGEDLVYLGDTARYPYGAKPLDEVREYAIEIAEYLVDRHQIKYLVVACNTAAAAALAELQELLPVPVMGVIDPGVRAALMATETGRIGVIGTVGTIGSGAYREAFRDIDPLVELTSAPVPASSSSSNGATPKAPRSAFWPSDCSHPSWQPMSTRCSSAAPTTPTWLAPSAR